LSYPAAKNKDFSRKKIFGFQRSLAKFYKADESFIFIYPAKHQGAAQQRGKVKGSNLAALKFASDFI
jgi:regulation of enolase protein 1 (concanavalin A-like superfamily)